MKITLFEVRCSLNIQCEPWVASQVVSVIEKPNNPFVTDRNELYDGGVRVSVCNYYVRESLYLGPSVIHEIMDRVLSAIGDNHYEMSMTYTVKQGGPT